MPSDFFVANVDQRLPILSDQLVESNVLLRWLRDKGRVKLRCGGDGFSFRVRKTASDLVRSIGDWSLGQARTQDNFERIEGDYAAYGAELMQSRLQKKRQEYGDATSKVFDMFEEQLNDVYQAFESYLGADMTGDGTPGAADEADVIDGLAAINDTDNTFLGVNRATASNDWWRSYTRAVANNFHDDDDADGVVNGLYSLRLAFLDACRGGMFKEKGVGRELPNSKSKPDLIYSGLTSFVNYCTALQPQQQYVNGGKNDPGQEVALFGVPYMWDTYAQDDRVDFLNSKALQYLCVGESMIYRDVEDELGASGTPRASAIGLVHQGAFVCYRPNLLSFATNTD